MGQPPVPNTWPSPDQPAGGQGAGPAQPASPWPAPEQPVAPVPAPPAGQQWPPAGPSSAPWPQQPTWQDPSGAQPAPPQPQPSYGPAPGQSMYGVRPDGQPAGPQQGSYGQFTFPTPPKQKLEPLAVAGLATSPLGPVGIALGVLARGRVKQTRRRSMGLAWTAIALGALFTVGWGMLAAVLTLNGTVDRAFESPQPGDVEQARTIASANLAVGNCIATLPPAEEVGELRLVPCAESHIAQVVSQHQLDGSYPGPEQLGEQATSTCTSDVEDIDPADASIEPWFLTPSEAGWAQGNTRIVCLLRGAAGPITVDLVN